MRSVLLSTLSLATVTLGLALSGCASKGGGNSADAAGAPMQVAMMCPKCETVWTRDREVGNQKVHAFSSKRQMVCPTCEKTASTHLMADGQPMMHDCPECKATMVAVTPGPGPANPKGPRP